MYAIPRKKRKSEIIKKTSQLFSKAIDKQDYKKSASVVLWCVLKEFAQEGIINALDDANSFIKGKKFKRGL